MEDQSPRRRIPMGIMASLSALVVTSGSAAAWLAWTTHPRNAVAPSGTAQRSEETQPLPSEQPSPSATTTTPSGIRPAPITAQQVPAPDVAAPTAPTEKVLQVYWLKTSSSEIELMPVPVKLSASNGQTALLTGALDALLAEPPNATVSTAIPNSTQLRGVTVKNDGIHIDLSNGFTTGGGTTSMTARLAQLIYTATSLDPDAPVWIAIEGKPLTVLGGEGLMLDQPLTRQSFERSFPF